MGCADMLLIDTHVLLWLDRDDPALGPCSRELIASAWNQGEVAVCAISFWEVAMLAARDRIVLPQTATIWRTDWLRAGLREIPLDGEIALAAAGMQAFHADPADRFIVACALLRGATLVSADRAILAWSGPLRSQPAGT